MMFIYVRHISLNDAASLILRTKKKEQLNSKYFVSACFALFNLTSRFLFCRQFLHCYVMLVQVVQAAQVHLDNF